MPVHPQRTWKRSHPINDVARLTARLERLEGSQRRLRRLLALALGGLALAFIFQPTPSVADGKKSPVFGTVQADRLAIMKDGKVAMLLGAKKKTAISLFDAEGRPRAILSVSDEGPMLSLNGPDKKPRVVARWNEQHGSHMIIFDESGGTKKKIH
jgi:hypothetical protein